MLDLSTLPVVDAHCHPFLKHSDLTARQFLNLVAFPGAGADFLVKGGVAVETATAEVERARQDTVYVRYLIHQLATFFGCEPTLEQIVEQRNRATQDDFYGYVKRLYDACHLTAMVTDFGYPKPPLNVTEFKANAPIEVIPLYRIETFIDVWLDKEVSWEEFSRHYEETISNALEHEGYMGLKSVIAYRTGLDVSPLSRASDQGLQAWAAIRRGVGNYKQLRDHLLCRALELCLEYDVPMQIHTGMGDYEVNLIECRPALLMDLLRFPAFRACKVLLVHTGYPYHAEAGYMANMLPRVYCDVSEGIPFAGNAARRIYAEVLEMAPLSKVVYGADGYIVPEIAYVGAMLGKKALAQALEDLVVNNMLTQAEAQEAAGWILAGNARRLYGLDD